MKIIHISDLHYGSNLLNSQVIHKSTTKLVKKIIAHYSGENIKPLIVLTGDILASSFRKKKSRSARSKLKRLIADGFEILICPGNHDIKDSGIGPTLGGRKKFNKIFKRLLPTGRNVNGDDKNTFYHFPLVHNFEGYHFIGLDSMKAQNLTGAKGELGTNQLNKLKDIIADIKEANNDNEIIIYLHHSPFAPNDLELIDKRAFLDSITGVNALLFGHHHINKRYEEKEEEYDINCIVNSGNSTASNLHWTEINTEDYSANFI
jgi:predicted MPP superfamily phosphohydrolase